MKLEDYSEYYIQGSDHYLIPKDVFKELFTEIINWKNDAEKSKKHLDYITSGEYYNQLRFERDMLQSVVDNSEVSKEDKEFIDMTHRNTELIEENQELKKQLHEASLTIQEMTEQDIWCPSSCDKFEKLITQQQEFIKYLEDEINKINPNKYDKEELYRVYDYETMFNYTILIEILNKYKEILGGNND